MKHAYDYAKNKLGVEIDPKEIDDKVASGPRKPSKGKTNTYRLKGKDGKKAVQIQVYGMDNGKYELNMYKEEVELDEKRDEPPFDVSKADYSGAAKELTQYAKTKGGMDKDDFLSFANRMREIAKKKSPKVMAKFARDLEVMDTSPREKIVDVMRKNGIKVTMKGNKMMIEGFGAELTTTQRLRAMMETEVPVVEQKSSVGQSIMEKAIARVREVREAEGEKMTDAQLKRREEIAKDLPDDEFKKRYGDEWMQVKMATATKMAKGEK
jgi:hypothetical protein